MTKISISPTYSPEACAVLFNGDCMELLAAIPSESVKLIITSPPYNLGKEYERRTSIDDYVGWQAKVIRECVRVLHPQGSICWQVGNFVNKGQIIPLDVVLYPLFAAQRLQLRNRVIWHFEHGLHATNRLSGRYETINWFTKSDAYTFNVDPIRVPQKYPGKKHFKGPNAGKPSGNPLGKNPGDVWVFPNVKSNHVEKTDHPCQFPVELVDRFILPITSPGDWVLDPFAGVGTTIAAAVRRNRRGIGAETRADYVAQAKLRIIDAFNGTLPVREMGTPVFDPRNAGTSLITNPWQLEQQDRARELQLKLMERASNTYREHGQSAR